MKYIEIGKQLKASAVALGCMRIAGLERKPAEELLQTALAAGIDFFDHADIYGGGGSESVFAQAMQDAGVGRDKVLLQTKCGIRKGFFDFSKEHIVDSLEKSLQRLKTDYVDVYMLHRPDTLMEPEEVAEAFAALHKAGKVRHFGVSNQNPAQMRLLGKYLGERRIIANQLQFSPAHTGMINLGLNVNMLNASSVDHDGSVLEFCRLEDITLQAWSPFLYGFFEGVFLGDAKFPELNAQIDLLAKAKGVSPEAIVIAWILRHPAKIQPIPGTTKPERVQSLCQACAIDLSREEWYQIYCAAGNVLP